MSHHRMLCHWSRTVLCQLEERFICLNSPHGSYIPANYKHNGHTRFLFMNVHIIDWPPENAALRFHTVSFVCFSVCLTLLLSPRFISTHMRFAKRVRIPIKPGNKSRILLSVCIKNYTNSVSKTIFICLTIFTTQKTFCVFSV